MVGAFLLEQIQEGQSKAKNSAGINSLGIVAGILGKSKVGPKNQGHGIEQKKSGTRIRHGFKSTEREGITLGGFLRKPQ
jgi:hypothetical protein